MRWILLTIGFRGLRFWYLRVLQGASGQENGSYLGD